MKRYALFGWQHHQAKGGINDLLATADYIRELQLQVVRYPVAKVAVMLRVGGKHVVDLVQIVDTATGQIVLASERFRESNSEPYQVRWVEPAPKSPALTRLL